MIYYAVMKSMLQELVKENFLLILLKLILKIFLFIKGWYHEKYVIIFTKEKLSAFPDSFKHGSDFLLLSENLTAFSQPSKSRSRIQLFRVLPEALFPNSGRLHL